MHRRRSLFFIPAGMELFIPAVSAPFWGAILGAVAPMLGGGGGAAGGAPAAPAGPVESGKVNHGDFIFGNGNKTTGAPATAPWVMPVVVGGLAILTLGLVFLILPRGSRRRS